MWRKTLFCSWLFLLVSSLHAEQPLWVGDALSPIKTKAIAALGIGTLATTIIYLDHHNLDGQARDKALFRQPFGRYGAVGEVIGWGYLNGLYILGHGLHGYFTKNAKSLERGEMMSSASFFTLTSTAIIKASWRRARPQFKEEEDSFPSGHSSMAFAFASLVTMEHGYAWGIPAHLAALGIAYSRVNDGRHWLSDIVAGATIGASYGIGVYLNRRAKEGKAPSFYFNFLPDISQERYGLHFQMSF